MAVYFNTNLQEARGLLAFDRISTKLSDTLHRLETGYRINSAKDDPTGLVTREIMRADIQGTKAALRNTAQADNLFNIADKAMGQIASQLNGNPDSDSLGLIGILSDTTITAAQKREQVNAILDTVDKLATSTIYGGKQIIGGALDYSVSNISDAAKLSDVRVTRAENTQGATPQKVNLTVDTVAQKAGLYAVNDPVLAPGETMLLTIKDSDGKSLKFSVENSLSVSAELKQLVTDATALNAALESEGVSVRARIATASDTTYDGSTSITPDQLIFESTKAGRNQSVSVTASGNGTPVLELNDMNTAAAAASGTVKGVDWAVTGFEGTSWTDGDYITVSSNAVAFSAKLEGAAKGDTLSFDVSGGASFQLGKDVVSMHRLNVGIQDMRTTQIGGPTGKLNDLRSLDYDNDADLKKALEIAQEAIKDVASSRGRLGMAQNLMSANRENLEDQLVLITDSEAKISNTNVAEETSRLARYELIAQSAVSSIQYSRAFASFAVSSLF